jgi:hypothetical protein
VRSGETKLTLEIADKLVKPVTHFIMVPEGQ